MMEIRLVNSWRFILRLFGLKLNRFACIYFAQSENDTESLVILFFFFLSWRGLNIKASVILVLPLCRLLRRVHGVSIKLRGLISRHIKCQRALRTREQEKLLRAPHNTQQSSGVRGKEN